MHQSAKSEVAAVCGVTSAIDKLN